MKNKTKSDLYIVSVDGEHAVGGSTLGRGFVEARDFRICFVEPHPDPNLPEGGWESTLSETREQEIPWPFLRHDLTDHKLRKVG